MIKSNIRHLICRLVHSGLRTKEIESGRGLIVQGKLITLIGHPHKLNINIVCVNLKLSFIIFI